MKRPLAMLPRTTADVLIVGAGPSGLAAAIELRRRGVGRVLVIDREPQAGGMPRWLDHLGFGMRDLLRIMSGPAYAQRYAQLAEQAGVEVRLETAATSWTGALSLATSSPRGVEEITARAIVLATGCRERPRAARLVPGSRPQGVITSGALQRLVVGYGLPVGRRAVIVGAENVSMADVMTLSEAGVATIALVTEHPVDQAYWPLARFIAARYRAPVLTGTQVTAIVGRRRVEAVEVVDLATGRRRRLACDTVVFSGDWIPDHELARLGGIEIDPGTRGPRVDLAQRTSRPGVFAVGNVLHAAELADVAALCGRFVANPVLHYLRDGVWLADGRLVRIVPEPPVAWVTPSAIEATEVTAGSAEGHGRGWLPPGVSAKLRGPLRPPRSVAMPHGHFILRVERVVPHARLEARQGGRILWVASLRRLRPTLPVHAPSHWLRDVRTGDGPVTFLVDG
jgi:NADPH-dependent 2,4-dienoyl-CoA reductase/sulfur reductase-like enzyme